MSDLQKLQADAKPFSILYVEDNEQLKLKAGKLLKKIFPRVDLASDGQMALKMFKEYHYPIIITDIKMPNMDGITLLKHIKEISSDTKCIIVSAFDDKEFLLQSIEVGVFRYLQKPVNISELTDVLQETINTIKSEQDSRLFYVHLKNLLNYQSAMVAMVHGKKIIFANQTFIDFFACTSPQKCDKSLDDIGKYFLKHDSFLYNRDEIDVAETLELSRKKLYHVKLENQNNEICHCLVKYQMVPEKHDYSIISFDDITDLNLLRFFDEKQTFADDKASSIKEMFQLLNLVKMNNAQLDIHNYYKGLSITNSAVIVDIKDDSITIKTTYIQQKAIQIQKRVLIVSNTLPYVIESREIESMSFEKQTVILKSLYFIETSPVTRSTIRVCPEGNESISLFIDERKFFGEIKIEDISINAVKVELNALPAGFNEESEVILDMVFEVDKKPLIINTKVTLFRKEEHKSSFSLVFIFKDLKKSVLIKYITKRQMALIREIKGMQNG